MARLCVCVNQVGFVRNSNKRKDPDPVTAAIAAELAGIDGIIAHFKEDRSDLTDRDISVLKQVVQSHLNLAIPMNDDMVKKAIKVLPDMVTLVSSGYEHESEASLNVVENSEYLEDIVAALRANNIVASILIDPDMHQMRAVAKIGADYIQINTSSLAHVEDLNAMTDKVEQIRSVAMGANKLGLGISAGIGINHQTIRDLIDIPFIEEYNIGRSIFSRALLVGLDRGISYFHKIINPA
jgi:pyridoxine 5-phosphate synthase